jgi:steroid delta-isomerase-like uncharacterized protein
MKRKAARRKYSIRDENGGVSKVLADYIAARNAGDARRWARLFAVDGSYAELGGGSVTFGREETRRHFESVAKAVPDLKVTLTGVPENKEDYFLLKWNMEGTHQGEFAGMPGTGRRFKIAGGTAIRLRGRHIVRALDSFDIKALEREGKERTGGASKPTRILPNEMSDPFSGEDNIAWGE